MSKDKEMPFIEHIRELKDRFKVILISLIVTTLFWLTFPADPQAFLSNPAETYKPLISLILEKVRNDIAGPDAVIFSAKPTAGLELIFIGSLFMGIVTSMPVIAYEIYAYIDPALYPHERKLIYGFMASFLGLFAAGSLFGYFIAAPIVFKAMLIFVEFSGVLPFFTALDFFSLVFTTVLMIGFVFTVPAIFILLVRLGIVSTSIFTKNRLYIYGGLYILIAIITPDGAIVGNTVLFLPLVILLESSVYIAKRYERKREAELAALLSESPTNPEVRCKFCGAKMNNNDVFCPSCGRAQQ